MELSLLFSIVILRKARCSSLVYVWIIETSQTEFLSAVTILKTAAKAEIIEQIKVIRVKITQPFIKISTVYQSKKERGDTNASRTGAR